MSEPFNFEDFISGVTVTLPREDVPLYGVVNQLRIDEVQTRIDEIDELLREPRDGEAVGDERESSKPTGDLIAERDGLLAERDALTAEQEASAKWVEIRCLSAQEWIDVAQDDAKDVLDQISAQTQGTRNPMSRDDVERLRAVLLPAAWALLVNNANRVASSRLVMPDFSPSASASRSKPTS